MADTLVAITILGSDSRLESEIESGRDEALHFKAPAAESRLALYGPYAALPPGHFRIELLFGISERGSGDISIELIHRKAALRLYTRTVFAWEVDRGLIRMSYPFEKAVEDLEIRLRVPPNCAGSIKQLSIRPRTDDVNA
jgi:hypothetical protein